MAQSDFRKRAVFGIYDTRSEVETAVDALKDTGFRNADVSVLMPQLGDSLTFAHERSTKAPEGAAAGTGAGALIGGAFGWLIGIGAISVFPFLGPFVAAGPIMATLAGMGVGGAVGGLSGALIGLGAPEYEARRYEKYVKEGGILISVHVDDAAWARKAKTVLESTGAHDVAVVDEVNRHDDGPPHLPGGPAITVSEPRFI